MVKTDLIFQGYNILKEMIADRRFTPGSYINVQKLAQIERTPISSYKLLKELLERLRCKAFPLAFKLVPHFSEFLDFHSKIFAAL